MMYSICAYLLGLQGETSDAGLKESPSWVIDVMTFMWLYVRFAHSGPTCFDAWKMSEGEKKSNAVFFDTGTWAKSLTL